MGGLLIDFADDGKTPTRVRPYGWQRPRIFTDDELPAWLTLAAEIAARAEKKELDSVPAECDTADAVSSSQ